MCQFWLYRGITAPNGNLPLTTVNGGPPQTLILWDSTRWDTARYRQLHERYRCTQTKMAAFAARPDVNGQVVDLHQFARVVSANSQADANTACPAAKNLVANEIKSDRAGLPQRLSGRAAKPRSNTSCSWATINRSRSSVIRMNRGWRPKMDTCRR